MCMDHWDEFNWWNHYSDLPSMVPWLRPVATWDRTTLQLSTAKLGQWKAQALLAVWLFQTSSPGGTTMLTANCAASAGMWPAGSDRAWYRKLGHSTICFLATGNCCLQAPGDQPSVSCDKAWQKIPGCSSPSGQEVNAGVSALVPSSLELGTLGSQGLKRIPVNIIGVILSPCTGSCMTSGQPHPVIDEALPALWP